MFQKQLLILLALFGVSGASQALTITMDPFSPFLTGSTEYGTFDCSYALTPGGDCYVSNENGGHDTTVFAPLLDDLEEAYKAEFGEAEDGPFSTEEGPLASSYETTFNSDASGATIIHTGGAMVTGEAWLIVKGGDEDPSRYAFLLSALFPGVLSWNGIETIVLAGFWPLQGAISHIALYGDFTGSEIPVPAAVWLFGTALLGLVGFSRRKTKV